ncbi:hypothetical protein UN63_04500 [Oceanisphaera arctica]|uniref:Uncharacterized protein n=1 Tax=Oceanisphaera arctica TaxID=641510 RepID=A0A2P5TPI0_9GAMM|nr:hypothetical protein UN63_04500 [Oceanisphaera arctica]
MLALPPSLAVGWHLLSVTGMCSKRVGGGSPVASLYSRPVYDQEIGFRLKAVLDLVKAAAKWIMKLLM